MLQKLILSYKLKKLTNLYVLCFILCWNFKELFISLQPDVYAIEIGFESKHSISNEQAVYFENTKIEYCRHVTHFP